MARLLSLCILFLLLGHDHGQTTDFAEATTEANTEQVSTTTGTPPYVCRPEIDRFCYLTDALNYILLGPNADPTSFDALLDIPPDSESLDWFIKLGLQNLYVFMENNPNQKPG